MNGRTGAFAIVGLALLVGPVVADQPKHDSNTLHKIGGAIQYVVRKDTENLSVDVHRAEGRKSVVSERPQKLTAVVIPNGKTFVIHHRGYYAHRTETHRLRYHHRKMA
ncbi:MAG: hypothetical protein ACLQVD_13960 [Capsulimonadaceae bacterium]